MGFRLIHLIAAVAAYVAFKWGYKEYTVHNRGAILITGASTGIGRHAVEYLAEKHPDFLLFAGVRKQKDADLIAAMQVANIRPVLMDVTNHSSCERAMQEVAAVLSEKQLPLIALVNNAGVSRKSPLEFQDMDDIRLMFDTNFFGTLDMTKLALPLLRESKGRIVMMSSVSGFFSRPTSSIYSATKFAMEAVSDALRRELSHFGISVSVIQPAFVQSNIANNTWAATHAMFDRQNTSEMEKLYGNFLNDEEIAKHHNLVTTGSNPIVTSEAIEHAITHPFPKTRYVVAVVGKIPAKLISWLVWALPDRLEDALTGN